MSLAFTEVTESSAKVKVGGQTRLEFTPDGGAKLPQSPTQASDPQSVATLENVYEFGGLPRFTPYVWGGRADAMPQGDTQSSGQQLLDLMYPDMRADVVATQYTCTEVEWQADPYKRVTHWSLGDGVSWMRPPDKNGVQPGNVGAFYGVGSNPAGALTGTAVTDAGRNLTGTFATSRRGLSGDGYVPVSQATGAFDKLPPASGSSWTAAAMETQTASVVVTLDASRQWPVADEFRPRTWYGIWMIRMYGRVLNPGGLDATALNARMDMIDGRVSALEGLLDYKPDFPYAPEMTFPLPNGLRIKIGRVTAPAGASGSATYTYPEAFPHASLYVAVTDEAASPTNIQKIAPDYVVNTRTGFTYRWNDAPSNGIGGFSYFAIGY